MIASLAWRNIWRQPIRTGLSMLGMAFTSMLLVFMLSFQFGSYDTMKSSMLKISEGFGQFQVAGYKGDPEISKVIKDPAALRADLAGFKAISAITTRSTGFVLLANGERSFAAAIVGVDPENEPKVSTLSSLVKQGRALTPKDTNAVILGEGLARNLRLKLGDPVTMLGSGTDGSVAADVLTLVGIFKTGVSEIDRQMAQMPIARFDAAFLMDGGVNIMAITGDDFNQIVGLTPQMRKIAARHDLVYLDWGQIQPAIKSAIALDMSTAMLMYTTLVIVVVFIILNTLYMSVLERTREFGMLLALGMKPAQIGRMVWLEMIFLSLFGSGIGIALGMAFTAYVQSVGIAFEGMDEVFSQWGLPSRIYPDMTPLRVLLGPSAIVGAIAVLGIIPYRRVLGLEPVSAMGA
jgi:putative ABC transport system permease protein